MVLMGRLSIPKRKRFETNASVAAMDVNNRRARAPIDAFPSSVWTQPDRRRSKNKMITTLFSIKKSIE